MRLAPVLLACAACGPPPEAFVPDAEPPVDGPPAPDAPRVDPFAKVYVHSYQTLYAVDPVSLELSRIGAFDWPEGSDDELMTDIAVDRDGKLTGISFGALYAIDEETAAVTYLAPLGEQQFNGLSWLPGADDDDEEILIGTGKAGTVWRIDPTTGASVQTGAFGGLATSSGDIVSVKDFGTVATVKNGSKIDYLARIDDATGEATIIGNTGWYDIWGVGFWAGRVFGFVATNELVLIDVDDATTTFVLDGPENWAGAGVTTRAPVVD